jgi:hypothetical protein
MVMVSHYAADRCVLGDRFEESAEHFKGPLPSVRIYGVVSGKQKKIGLERTQRLLRLNVYLSPFAKMKVGHVREAQAGQRIGDAGDRHRYVFY